MTRYIPAEIEPKWQKIWADDVRYQAPDSSEKPKYYVSGMFPYPSGAGMHTGHFFEHSIVDAVARFRRSLGHNVMYPMGWDSFGLPAENYAIKTGKAPAVTTKENIASFKNQLRRVGASIDWSREINTTDPAYYKWTQWVFTKLFERGLAYQKEANQWWCPVDKTVLANEQVEGGKCWRCGSEVVKKSMKQWFFKITQYADALLEEIPELDWPDKIKTAQTNWIGKSVGAEVEFAVAPRESRVTSHESRSYIMGVDAIAADLEKIGVTIHETVNEGHYKVTFPEAKKQAFEKLIAAKLKPGFWNEYIGNDVTFIFKDKQGVVRKIKWSEETEQELLALCNEYAAAHFDSIRTMLLGNDWYSRASYLVPRASIRVFTTRPDTLFGATFLVLAPEHPLAHELATDETREELETYIAEAIKKSEIERQSETKEKTGVFTGSYAINPVNGEKVPIWVADYVLGGYGTGAIMAVPAHDERDYEFAKKFNLPIVEVIEKPSDFTDECYHGDGILVNSAQFDGIPSAEARELIVRHLEREGKGKEQVNYKMRDWLISRQRYWGAPIPMIHCPEHGAVAVPEKDLPVLLPEVEDYAPRGDGKSVLAAQEDWVNTTCPTCGGPAKRETDTMDGYACSSWYLLRFTDPKNSEQAWAPEKAAYWTPLDMYIGGDHAVAHLLYVRFWSHVFYDMQLVPTKEPVKKLVYHGLIQAEDGRKMSKSLGNVVDPLEVIDQGYGADALRTFELFLGPVNEDSNWSSRGISGVYRFLNRYWTLVQEYLASDKVGKIDAAALDNTTHATIKKVTDDMYRLSFNTAIAALMEYVNDLYKLKVDGFSDAWQQPLEALTQLVQPFAPHIAAEVWQQLGRDSQLDFETWPEYDEAKITTDTLTIVLQVNGKVRGTIEVPVASTKDDLECLALENERVQSYVGNKKPARIIVVPGRLVNVVV